MLVLTQTRRVEVGPHHAGVALPRGLGQRPTTDELGQRLTDPLLLGDPHREDATQSCGVSLEQCLESGEHLTT